jgi:hypothetical protein
LDVGLLCVTKPVVTHKSQTPKRGLRHPAEPHAQCTQNSPRLSLSELRREELDVFGGCGWEACSAWRHFKGGRNEAENLLAIDFPANRRTWCGQSLGGTRMRVCCSGDRRKSGRASVGSGARERVIVGDRESGRGARAGMPTGVRPERPAGQEPSQGERPQESRPVGWTGGFITGPLPNLLDNKADFL